MHMGCKIGMKVRLCIWEDMSKRKGGYAGIVVGSYDNLVLGVQA